MITEPGQVWFTVTYFSYLRSNYVMLERVDPLAVDGVCRQYFLLAVVYWIHK